MKKNIFLLLVAFWPFLNGAQNDRSLALHLSSGLIIPEANYEIAKKQSPLPQEVFNGVYYRYIQFFQLPSQQEQQQMAQLGITLTQYLPENTFMAAIDQAANLSQLSNFNVRSVITIQPEYKLLKELQVALSERNFPGYAVRGNLIGIGFTYYGNLQHNAVKNWLKSNNYNITYEDEQTNWFVTWVNKNSISTFVGLPFVSTAELVDDVPQADNLPGRTSHRSNAISTSFSGGRKYNGNGVKVMLQDDGIIGPHIDYTGRLQQFLTSNGGDHGDHCAGIIMGAGNRNPTTRGMAWGSDIFVYAAAPSYQGFDSITTHYGSLGIRIISTSYSDGCNAGYTTRARQLDVQNMNMPQLIHVFSGGNAGTSDCSYGAGAGWGNVTGGHKHSKNSIAVANLDFLDALNSSSSRGPAHDGRLKPEISAVGTNVNSTTNPDNYVLKTGTSMSCPGIAGIFAQLYEAYSTLNGNVTPQSALIKTIIMNSADDLGNAGPDFSFGYGRVNALNAVKVIESNQYLSGSISNGGTNTHNIAIPAGVRQVKVLTYWHDQPAAVNAAIALVNNLNTTIQTPASATINPLVLDFTPTAANLSSVAVQGVDVRNNHEQIVLNNPSAGNYVLRVNGAAVPTGPQPYFVTWIFYMDDYTITYPMGGEGFVPGETETIRWDAFERVGNQTLEYTTNNGATWTLLSNTIPGAQRHFNWSVPTGTISGQCRVRISRGALNDQSDAGFSIIPLPTNISVNWACPDSVRLTWNAVAGATAYDIYKLGNKYMDSVGTSNTNSFIVTNVLSNQVQWFSVRARGASSAVGRRANAIQKSPGTFACPITNDAACNNLVSPAGTLPSCQNLNSVPVNITLLNAGINTITNVPVFYRINNGAIVSELYTGSIAPSGTVAYNFTTTANFAGLGNYTLKAWAKYIADPNVTNDTSIAVITVINGANATLPLTENFETFSLCSTAANCSLVCGLGNGFINENNTIADQLDWRVNEGVTPSANTGPDFDFVPGTPTGNYIYLEATVPCINITANLLSPCMDLATINNPLLTFAYHMFGANMGTLRLDVLANGAWTNNIWSMTGNKGNTWLTAAINLAPWAGQKVNFRWSGTTGNDFASDMALDAISVQSSVGLLEKNALLGVSVFPNPGNGVYQLSITGLQNTNVAYEIFDVNGKQVANENFGMQSGNFDATINIEKLANGFYTLQLKRGEALGHIKLCKY